ncbi:MAG: hypothetical protein P8L22_01355 [Acidimicrobiales bacterium]|nr:hypothetical protein [Acidimicrobiales bacterium]
MEFTDDFYFGIVSAPSVTGRCHSNGMEASRRSLILLALSDDQYATIVEIAGRTGSAPMDVFIVCMESGSQRKWSKSD